MQGKNSSEEEGEEPAFFMTPDLGHDCSTRKEREKKRKYNKRDGEKIKIKIKMKIRCVFSYNGSVRLIAPHRTRF